MAKKEAETIETVETEEIEERSGFSGIKMAMLAVLALILVTITSSTVLYMTNKDAKKFMDTAAKKIGIVKDKKKEEPVDYRVTELAEYYLSMSVGEASDKLLSIKKEDKKLYPKILSAMIAENSVKAGKITEKIKEKEAKENVLQREYEAMNTSYNEKIMQDAAHYSSLGLKGAVDAMETRINNTMDFENMARIIENMQPTLASKVLYYMDVTYADEINKNLTLENRVLLDKERDKYTEFVRKNTSLSVVYNEMEPKMAAKELEDTQRFKKEELGLIFSKMDYLNAARILKNFEDQKYVAQVLETVKEYEDYESVLVDSISEVIADSLKVLQKYDEDVDILKKAYEKVPSADLADIIDKNTGQTQVYKEYKIDEDRSFRISEKDMTVEVLKRSKPTVVSSLLSELKSSERVDKAAYLSREIGIPQP